VPTLRGLAAARGLFYGAALSWLDNGDAPTMAAAQVECGALAAASDLKWDRVHPLAGSGPTDPAAYDFSRGDTWRAFAVANQMLFRGHTLAWHNSNPAWIFDGTITPANAQSYLEGHIDTVIGHFPGIHHWDVVNEAILLADGASDGVRLSSPWYIRLNPTPVTITSSSVANPSIITTAAAHGLTNGQTAVIGQHSGSTPNINGSNVITFIDTTHFSIPVNVTTGGTGGAVGLQMLGKNYIRLAYARANTAAPNTPLEYNDFGIELAGTQDTNKWNAVLALLQYIKAGSGCRLDVLGFQGHLWPQPDGRFKDTTGAIVTFDPDVFRARIRAAAALGLKIVISELDVKDNDLSADIPTRDAQVAAAYRTYLNAALAEPAVIGVFTFGLSDKNSWLLGQGATRPLPLDVNMQRKQAWDAIAAAFQPALSRTALTGWRRMARLRLPATRRRAED